MGLTELDIGWEICRIFRPDKFGLIFYLCYLLVARSYKSYFQAPSKILKEPWVAFRF